MELQVLSTAKPRLALLQLSPAVPACWAGPQERGTLILDREDMDACPGLTLPALMGTWQDDRLGSCG